MFNNLEEQIESTQGPRPTQGARVIRYLVVTAICIVLFGGLSMGVWLLEY